MSSEPTATNIVVPDKPDVLVNSSSVQGYSYDAQTYQLTVWFKGNKKQSVYRYFLCFPPMMSAIFSNAGSIGKKARESLKGLRAIKLR